MFRGASHFPIVKYHLEGRLEALDKRHIFERVEGDMGFLSLVNNGSDTHVKEE